MKKVILTLVGILSLTCATAQEKNKFRIGMDLGYIKPIEGNGGASFAIEPKFNITDNMNVGLRVGTALMARSVTDAGGNKVNAKLTGNVNFALTYDYYIKSAGSSFAPYIGVGVGNYRISAANVTIGDNSTLNTTAKDIALNSESKFGALGRIGFEVGKVRLGAEYNFVPKSVQNINKQDFKYQNSYVGVTLGFYLGGGKWSSAGTKSTTVN